MSSQNPIQIPLLAQLSPEDENTHRWWEEIQKGRYLVIIAHVSPIRHLKNKRRCFIRGILCEQFKFQYWQGFFQMHWHRSYWRHHADDMVQHKKTGNCVTQSAYTVQLQNSLTSYETLCKLKLLKLYYTWSVWWCLSADTLPSACIFWVFCCVLGVSGSRPLSCGAHSQ